MAGSKDGTTNTAVATWRGGWLCSVAAGGFSLTVDEPPAVGGTGRGPMPTDLLLASLSSCYALALAWAARKQGLELPDLTVTATGTYDGQCFGALELSVRTSLPAHVVEPLLEPAKQVCYVSNTLADPPGIDVVLEGAQCFAAGEAVRMRDGVVLRADVYLPASGGPHPTVLLRSPYRRNGAFPALFALPYARRGYAVVLPAREEYAMSGGLHGDPQAEGYGAIDVGDIDPEARSRT